MAFRDMREFIQKLDDIGEVQKIEREVDWNLEMGAIIRRSYDLKAPAPFFLNVKDYPKGYRGFGAPMGLSAQPGRERARVATALGLKPEASYQEIMDYYIGRKKNLIKPVRVSGSGAPCKENILEGDQVDVEKFPSPIIHGGDGGRYIGTWHAVITKDPDTGWVNWGVYRLMVLDKKRLTGLVIPNQHIGLQYYPKYVARNQKMEFALAFGTEPVSTMISCEKTYPGVNEVDVAGAVRGEPVELVKCETVDLEVPATSEIVFEGTVDPQERAPEGPFGEFTGYQASEVAPRPVYRVQCITHRNDPILPITCMGVPVDDSAAWLPIAQSADLLDDLRSRGYPVKMVYTPPESVGFFVVVSTNVPFAGYVKQIANAIWSSPYWGQYVFYIMVVNEDVDVTDLKKIVWSLFTRCHPMRGIHPEGNAPGHNLVPWLDMHEKKHHMAARCLLDCTWPVEWPKDEIPPVASFEGLWPKETQEKVLKNWKAYGYK